MDARELTRDEKKKIRTLVTGMCANYDRESGLCLPLDCACYMLHKCWTKRPERKIVDDAIEVLVNLNHRGAVGAEENKIGRASCRERVLRLV